MNNNFPVINFNSFGPFDDVLLLDLIRPTSSTIRITFTSWLTGMNISPVHSVCVFGDPVSLIWDPVHIFYNLFFFY